MNLTQVFSSRWFLIDGTNFYGSEKRFLLSLVSERPYSKVLLKKDILKHVWMVRVLMTRGCTMIQNNYGQTPILLSICWNLTSSIYFLIKITNEDINKSNLLSIPVYKNFIKSVRLLLQAGADPNNTNRTNETPLYYSVFWGHIECVRLLLQAGANPNIKKCSNETPYQLALHKRKGNTELLKLLSN